VITVTMVTMAPSLPLFKSTTRTVSTPSAWSCPHQLVSHVTSY